MDLDGVRALNLPAFKGGVSVAGATDGRKRNEERQGGSNGEQVLGPFILGEALPVVPAKLVKRILKGDYVDMAELLKDNMEVERRRAQVEGDGSQGQLMHRGNRREIPDMLSWLQCFSLYAAVVGSRYPEKSQDLLAYQALMIGEHRRCGGRGWLLYDAAFRQQITSLEAVRFAHLNQSLYATTFLAYGMKAQCCPNCLMADHSLEECALNPSRAMQVVRLREAGLESREVARRADKGRRTTPKKGACFAWNDGRCTSPYCRFEHACSKCHGDHRRAACRARLGEEEMGRDKGRAKPYT